MKILWSFVIFLTVFLSGCENKNLEAENKQLEARIKQLEVENKQLDAKTKLLDMEKAQLEAKNKQLDTEKTQLQQDLSKIAAEEQKQKNRISPLQRDQLTKLLDSGSRLNSAVKDGVTLQNFRTLFTEFNGAVALATANWPQNVSTDPKANLEDAAKCWSFSQEVWSQKNEFEKVFSGFFVSDTPIPTSIKPLIKTSEYVGHDGVKLEQAPWSALQIGLATGSTLFKTAQTEILNELNK